ncbi:MAG: ankyrin repeat domain-containing protein [Flavobacteriales bacterium]|nr:ankyrin repeat domain-containing protein [Flavobacteriales bacterium]
MMKQIFKYQILILAMLFGTHSFGQTKKELKEIIKNQDTLGLAELLKNGFDINSDYSKGTCFLNQTILENKLQLTKYILKQKNVEIQRTQKDNFTTLHYLVSNGWYELAEYLIDNGVDPNTLGYNDSHILRTVIFNYQWNEKTNQSLDFIKYLFAKGINPQLSIDCCSKKTTLIILSTLWSDNAAIEFFIRQHPAKINDLDDEGKSALHYAIEKENIDAAKLLLENGADSNVKDTRGLDSNDYSEKIKNEKIKQLLTKNKEH